MRGDDWCDVTPRLLTCCAACIHHARNPPPRPHRSQPGPLSNQRHASFLSSCPPTHARKQLIAGGVCCALPFPMCLAAAVAAAAVAAAAATVHPHHRAAVAAAAVPLTKWRNSTEGIHAFLTFDGSALPANITAFADRVDFVWGADQVPAWRGSPNPDVVLSKYIPFCRDPDPTPHLDANKSGLAWWQNHHPELVLYQCDRTTPAWECFAGEGCAHVSVPLDLSNPGTLDFQMSAGVLPAAAEGYNAIAFDNYGLTNQWKACGAFVGPGGAWVQLYGRNGTDPAVDPQYTADVLNWTARAVARIHDEAGLLVIPNFSDMDLGDPAVLQAGNLTDGMLAEAGFAEWDPVPNTSSFHTPPPMTSPEKFKLQVDYVRNLQRYGKGFFSINEWGAGPDYGLNPSKIPYNISGDDHRAIRQFVVAAFMMMNGGAAGIYLTCIQCYGGDAGGDGGLSLWPEYTAPVGHPLGEPQADAASGVWHRNYSTGLAVVNPTNVTVDHALAGLPEGLRWADLYGHVLNSTTATVSLAPASGLVLLQVSH